MNPWRLSMILLFSVVSASAVLLLFLFEISRNHPSYAVFDSLGGLVVILCGIKVFGRRFEQ